METEKLNRSKKFRALAVGVGSANIVMAGAFMYFTPNPSALAADLFYMYNSAEIVACGIKNERWPVIARATYSHVSQVPYVSEFGARIKELFTKPSKVSLGLPYRL
jgi:hypothetical protein